ncbi:MAG: cupin domain-containing protein [Hyphomonadaceae bacterium]|nr:cupin domain-containing protein [Hyphomonadaceae bacterium]
MTNNAPAQAAAAAQIAGRLEPAFALMARTHAALQASCAVQAAAQSADIAAARRGPELCAAVWASQLLGEVLALPAPVRDLALHAIGAGAWRGAGGLVSFSLIDGPGPKAELLRIAPGKGAPSHTHGGMEYTLVLTGAFADATGRYAAGDIAVMGPTDAHRPTAEPGAICYALAVSEAPLKFTGALGVLQKFWKH